MNPRSAAVALLLAGLGTLVAAGPASGAPPDIEKLPPGSDTRVIDNCGFPVREDVRSRQGMVKTFYGRDGAVRTLRVSGAFTGTMTRVLPDGSDRTAVRINFSGPGDFDPSSGRLTARGPWLLDSPDDPRTPAADGFLLLTRGLAYVTADPDTAVLTVDARGNVTDLCAALA